MPHTLLLADDSLTIQRVIELTFADENVQVVAVSDGDQAIARLDAAPPDIVLADIGMPGKNGYEVAQYVKRTPRLQHIPVVLLAGAFEPVDQAKASAAGCDGVLAKPFEPQQVIGRVKELLARGGSAAPTKVEGMPPPINAVSEKLAPADIDSYFDRLGAAFGLGNDAPPPDIPLSYASAPPPIFEKSPAVKPFAPGIAEPAAVQAAATAGFETRPPATATAGTPAPGTQTADAAAAASAPAAQSRRPLPPIGDAFAALLAAEQNEPLPAAPPNWPSAAAPSPAAPAPMPVDPDELAADVARRVLEQLSDRVVRETVAGIVATVAERLVREEIERIKSTIK